MSSKQLKHKFRSTLFLPKTTFPMRANAAVRERNYVERSTTTLYRYQQQTRSSTNSDEFVLHDGPPYANGDLHVGHFLNKVLKDMINRSALLRGKRVSYLPGWDCHGLPIELKALKELRKGETTTPMEIRKRARKCAEQAIASQRSDMIRWGVLADWGNGGDDNVPALIDREYHTMDPEYEAEQLRLFAQLVRDGLIKRGFRPVYWSPSSRSALAEAELEYNSEHRSTAVHVSFRVDTTNSNLFKDNDVVKAVVWTTTPWTIPANMALCVNENMKYALLRHKRDLLIVAQDLVEDFRTHLEGEQDHLEQVSLISGSDLVGLSAIHPLRESHVPIISGDHVTSEAGTGIVHTAPAHGADDFAVYASKVTKRPRDQLTEEDVNGNLVSDGGQFTSFAGEQLQGLDVLSEGTSTVVKMLKENGSLLAENQNYIHRYPYDWRTNRPVIVRAMEQWFTNLDGGLLRRADKSLDSVRTIPEMGKSRLRSVVNARSEWCISRQRSWGVPIPAWQNINTEETILTPEMAEHLASVVETHPKGTDCWWELSNEELLPPSMKSQASEFRRMTDTLDVWFDSGVSWSSVVKSRLGTDHVPADVYLEGSDQHRGWFQSSLLTSSAINNRAPFKTLISHGFVVDANGRKMSKSLGNVVSPQKLVSGDLDDGVKNKKKNKKKKVVIGVNGDPVGADVLRVWAATSNYTKDVAIGDVQIQKASDSLRKIRNVARFLLGNTNDFVHHDSSLNCLKLRPIDRYILSLLRKTTRNTFEAYESYNFGLGFRELLDFVNNDMSSFYLDSCKDLLYADPVDSERRRAAQFTMSEALRKITLCVSPVAVFTAEDIFEHTPNTLWSRNEGIDSVFQHTISLDNNNDDADVDFTMWNEIRQIRGAANRVLENARRRGEIGSSLEGAMSLRFEDLDQISKQLDFARHLDGAADVFSVSQTEFLAGDGSNIFSSTTDGIVGGGEILGIETVETSAGSAEITVTKALGSQCHRCWKHCESVSPYGDDSDGGCVCSRCRDALS